MWMWDGCSEEDGGEGEGLPGGTLSRVHWRVRYKAQQAAKAADVSAASTWSSCREEDQPER